MFPGLLANPDVSLSHIFSLPLALPLIINNWDRTDPGGHTCESTQGLMMTESSSSCVGHGFLKSYRKNPPPGGPQWHNDTSSRSLCHCWPIMGRWVIIKWMTNTSSHGFFLIKNLIWKMTSDLMSWTDTSHLVTSTYLPCGELTCHMCSCKSWIFVCDHDTPSLLFKTRFGSFVCPSVSLISKGVCVLGFTIILFSSKIITVPVTV